jgi:hypothetical protein
MKKKTPAGRPGSEASSDQQDCPQPSPPPKTLPAPDDWLAEQVFRNTMNTALWRLRNSTNPIAVADAKQFLADHGWDIVEAEEIMKTRKSRRRA